MEGPKDRDKRRELTRRRFLQMSAAAGAGLLLPWKVPTQLAGAQVTVTTQIPLAGSAIARFVDPLPLLSLAGGTIETIVAGTDQITLGMQEFTSNVMPSGFVPATGSYTGTWVWGYRQDAITPAGPTGTFTGPVIVATRGTPTEIQFINNLGTTRTTRVLAVSQSVDQTLHWANPLGAEKDDRTLYDGPIPAVPHLHGGEVPPVLDGGPDAWFTSDGAYHGHAFYTKDGTSSNHSIYRYPNAQEAAPVWFHDHALGITRVNVYAGLAGAYALIDPSLPRPAGLHPVGLQRGSEVEYLVPLVIQDRTFDINGQFLLPAGLPYLPNWDHPYWVPEFVGDTIMVNGKVWPFLNVQQKRYRLLFVNGSNARTYEMFLTNPVTKVMGPPIYQIATDGGYLDQPVKIDPNAAKGQLTVLRLMPGERADVIVDFAGLPVGTTLILRNNAKTPYPAGMSVQGSTIGQIIQFRVTAGFAGPDTSYDPATGVPLRPSLIRLVSPATGTLAAGVMPNKTRQLTLNEVLAPAATVNGVAYPGGPLEILVNNTKWDGESPRTYGDFTAVTTGDDTTYYSELPNEGDTELWEIVNLTADAHPVHTHLTQFQVMNRQNFDVGKYNAAYAAAFPGATVNGVTYAPSVYIPGFGPPLNYNTGLSRALGGNPDVTPFLKGAVKPPDPNEAGWKDTAMVPPGMVTRFVVRYAPTDKALNDSSLYYPFNPDGGHGYVWHCHIIDHEDNEMMRPFSVTAKAGATRTHVKGTDY